MPEYAEDFDPEAPADLLPKSGEYPTEKVFYTTVVIDEIEGQAAQEIDAPIDVAIPDVSAAYDKPATGAIIRMEQSWYAQAVALGNLLHSVALAPGESTKIAVIDWSRRVAGSTAEDVSQIEALSNEAVHSRSISEVTSAVSTEAQSGFSRTTTTGVATETGVAAGGLFGACWAACRQTYRLPVACRARRAAGTSRRR